MSDKSFVHLHNHTEYSMLDGAARIKPLVSKAAALQMPAIAITDHGNTFGAYEFWKQSTAAGINPIIGMEAYVAPGSRLERAKVRWAEGGGDDVSGGGAYTHLTIWATTNQGMNNLFRLSSEGYLSGFYAKPRIDKQLMAQFAKDLIATTGCPGGEVPTRLRLGQYDEALRAAGELRDIFGEGNFFVELMDHSLEVEKRVRDDLLRLSRELALPLVATNDLHYVEKKDHKAHEALLCVQTVTNLSDPKRFRFESEEFYLKTAQEMRSIFSGLEPACDNTLLIAERCEIDFEKQDLLPRFPVPEGTTEAEWFEKEVWQGMQRRYPSGFSNRHRQQVDYEIQVIIKMGFPGYFLVVADFIAWARSQGIRVGPGRGSAAGSLVSYALGITELDPLEHNLIFERFLNPERLSMPDIDVDFDDRRRGEVIRYVTEKYGDDRVAQIVTFGTIKAKQAIKDAARVLGKPYVIGERLTKAMPPMLLGRDVSLDDVVNPESDRYAEGAEFREIIDSDLDSKQVFDLAKGLESLKRQPSVHAAGVIMSAKPLMEVIPIMRREEDGAIITQFDQPPCEDLGLLKMDFLGLRNLTVIDDTLTNVLKNRGVEVVLEELDLNADRKTFELLSRGETLGVFQLDGDKMRSLLRMLKPSEFEHISAVIALYRPGPMGMNSHTNYAQRKNGQQQAEGIHPELTESLREILDPTYGLIVYQEQVMAVAQKVAGYSLGQADLLRRAMGKKKPDELEKQFEIFSGGMDQNGYSPAAIKALWDTLLPFADYAFNKSHSAGYAVLSYWTAYLKANFPAEFMAALLTSVSASKDKLGVYLNECRRMGIRVLQPDVNQSIDIFAAVAEDIRFGLAAIRNVGQNVVESIAKVREPQFSSFADYLQRAPAIACSKRVVESLIKAGAFDSLGHTRRALLAIYEEAIDVSAVIRREAASGQPDLFGDLLVDDSAAVAIPELPEWTKRDLLAHEREMLGLYVSDHPLAGMEAELMRLSDMGAAALRDSELADGETVTVAGLITQVQHRIARSSGNQYAQVTLEDFSGELMVMIMGKTYQEFRDVLVDDLTVSIRGRISRRDEEVVLQGLSVEVIAPVRDGGGVLQLSLTEAMATREKLMQLARILDAHPGPVEVQVKLTAMSGIIHFMLPQRVRVGQDLFGELKALLGSDAVS